MSSSFTKAKLKTSREAIQAKDWQGALDAADQVVEHEADSYNGHVFRALALLNLERFDDSEAAYQKAIKVQPSQLLAWQGLEKFYTQRGQWEKAAGVLQREMDLAVEGQDAVKCAEALQRLVNIQREEGGRSRLAAALSFYLPDSPYFALLSTLPEPDQTAPTSTPTFEAQMAMHLNSLRTLLEVITLVEGFEGDLVEKEFEKSRMRMNAAGKSREQLRNEAGLSVWTQSKLPQLYDQVLAHVLASDQDRREAEHKLLVYRHTLLKALPNPKAKLAGPGATAATMNDAEGGQTKDEKEAMEMEQKSEARDRFKELAEGIVAINVSDELAWTTVLEWSNVFSLAHLDRQRLRAFVAHFPKNGLASSFKALLRVLKDEQFAKEQEELVKEQDIEIPETDLLSLALDGLEASSSSSLAHCIASKFYLLDRDFLSASDVASQGLVLCRRAEVDYAIDLSQTRLALELDLATALVYLHPPQHHARALRLLDNVLSVHQSIDALSCRSFVYQSAVRWQDARDLLANVTEMRYDQDECALSIFADPHLEARHEIAWCDINLGRLEIARAELDQVIALLEEKNDEAASDKAKAWWRLGRCLWQMGGDARNEPSQAFTCFVTSLKRNATYAPAFTSLGFYYLEVAEPPDAQRASKCFQKAFELDSRENEAARKLAEGFAEDREWDLVDVVARRTIEGEGGRDALSGALSSQRRHITRNAWAWKAIGAVEIHRLQYEKAISALQIAIRSEPDDAKAWQRLGEAYAASGRQSAALKTFAKVLDLDPEQWTARYCIADVERSLGNFEAALEILDQLTQERPSEPGIRAMDAETRLLLGLAEAQSGYVLRAATSLGDALHGSLETLESEKLLRPAWKVAGDALFHLARFEIDIDESLVDDCVIPLVTLADELGVDKSLPSITAVTSDTVAEILGDDEEVSSNKMLTSAVYLYKLRVLLHAGDEEVAGSAWTDLATSLHRLAQVLRDDGKESESATCIGEAIACVKEALKLEPGNEGFWCTLGNLCFEHSVKLAQHCYIKATECSPRDVIPWSNLGFLYLKHDDVGLANESFIRAQTIDPDWAQAWVGQAMVALAHGDDISARALLTHAHSIGEGSVLEGEYGLAKSVLDWSTKAVTLPSTSNLHSASFAISNYLGHRPRDASALHLSALLAERLGQSSLAIQRIDQATSLLEKAYEANESRETEARYAVAQANLGRIRLSTGDAEAAIEALTTALNLLSSLGGAEDDEREASEGLETQELKRVRVSAQLTVGIAQYANGDIEGALEALKTAEEEAEESWQSLQSEIKVQTAQILWAAGKRDEAQTRLLDHISSRSGAEHLSAILTLGAMGAVSSDEDLLAASMSELHDLGLDETNAKSSDTTLLLSTIELLRENPSEALSIMAKAVMLAADATTAFHAQCALVKIAIRLGQSSEMALEEARKFHSMVLADIEAGQAFLATSERLLAVAEASSKPQELSESTTSRPLTRSRIGKALVLEPSKSESWKSIAALS